MAKLPFVKNLSSRIIIVMKYRMGDESQIQNICWLKIKACYA